MSRKQWTDAQLYDLAGCVARRMTWRQIADEYKMSQKWVQCVYRGYLHRVEKGKFCHWTPMRLMNLHLERSRGVSVEALAHANKVSVLVVHQKLGEARRLLEGAR
ncbi:hypothetical protein [Comamonas odontotermitis]|uniref:hypothetical protein n=1 Tax=Comamonas odontotermitis TaxID=379895 RepID=UPI001CC459B7|nr:hypothetical protein [Comamonas odontotermitis]UBB15442.1 hypothetical protein LAD35_11205 [Comamonas odontotermitis]